MFEIIFTTSVLIYASTLFFIIVGLKKRFSVNDKNQPFVSIIVAARNEEKTIINCLASISKINYDPAKYEVIIVNDESSDNTAIVTGEFISGRSNFRIIDSAQESNIPKGKARALDTGINAAKGEILFITDADCAVPPNWINGIVKHYSVDTSMVCGFTEISHQKTLDAAVGLDLVYLLGVASGMVNHKLPVSCIGNNFSFRKSSYYESGGYASLGCSVNEDFYLLQSFRKKLTGKIKFPVENDSVVSTLPPAKLTESVNQKRRWASTMRDVPVYGLLVSFIAFWANFMCLFSGFYISSVSVYLLFLKFSLDYFYLNYLSKALFPGREFRGFLLFELYFLLYLIILPLTLLRNSRLEWKGRRVKGTIS